MKGLRWIAYDIDRVLQQNSTVEGHKRGEACAVLSFFLLTPWYSCSAIRAFCCSAQPLCPFCSKSHNNEQTSVTLLSFLDLIYNN